MGGRALKQIEKKAGGFVVKSHLLPPPSTGNRGGGGKTPAAANPAGPSPGDGRRGREKEEGGEGV